MQPLTTFFWPVKAVLVVGFVVEDGVVGLERAAKV